MEIDLMQNQAKMDKMHPLHPDAPRISDLVILAGPSGAGKTTIARRLLSQDAQIKGVGNALVGIRTDSKTLLTRTYRGELLIVEYATTSLHNTGRAQQIRNEIRDLIGRSDQAKIYTLRINRKLLVKRYFDRMADEKLRRTPGWLRYFRIRKWKQLATYAFSNDVANSYRLWDEMLTPLQQEFEGKRASFVNYVVQE